MKEAIAEIKAANPNAVIYDLGSGDSPVEGAIGLDLFASGERVLRCDLFSSPWTIETRGSDFVGRAEIPENSVDFLWSSHFVEHIPEWDAFWLEAYRVLRPGGKFFLVAPYYTSVGASQDPTHRQMISEMRMAYLDRAARDANKLHYFGDYDFGWSYAPWFRFHPDFETKSEDAKEFARKHYWNAVTDVIFFLQSQKPAE